MHEYTHSIHSINGWCLFGPHYHLFTLIQISFISRSFHLVITITALRITNQISLHSNLPHFHPLSLYSTLFTSRFIQNARSLFSFVCFYSTILEFEIHSSQPFRLSSHIVFLSYLISSKTTSSLLPSHTIVYSSIIILFNFILTFDLISKNIQQSVKFIDISTESGAFFSELKAWNIPLEYQFRFYSAILLHAVFTSIKLKNSPYFFTFTIHFFVSNRSYFQ